MTNPLGIKLFDVILATPAYEILWNRSEQLAIRCKTCGMISYNEQDREQKYCGYCHKFL